MNLQQIKAFTLVELIVVLTILAILWTISFITFLWYISQARDYTRITDISVMKNALEIFHLKADKFPLPTDWFTVTYSWSDIWIQWTFWKSTKRNIWDWDLWPNDPLTGKEYTYSLTNDRQEFQIAWILETDEFAFSPLDNLLQDSFAWDNITKAIVDWNYNWKMLKTLTWVNCEILSIPSIVSSQTETTTNLIDILTNTWLVFNIYNNLPTNYRWTKYDADGWFAFTSNKLVAYSDTWSCDSLYDIDDNNARLNLISGLQTAYSGTILKNYDWIKDIVWISLSNTWEVDYLSKIIINDSIWWTFSLVR